MREDTMKAISAAVVVVMLIVMLVFSASSVYRALTSCPLSDQRTFEE